jgi:energy-coupling factor transporter ATP-binding protein EcfA2
MRRRACTPDAILAALRVENAERCAPPLDDHELEAIAASVAKYAPAPDVAPAPPAETPDERRVEYLDLVAIREHGIPEVPWIVPGWLAEGDVALVSGDGGIGKSTTVAALAMAVATGQPWCGIPVNGAGLVLVFDEEQNESEVARLYTRLGAPHENLRVACQQGVNLTTAAGLSRLERELSEYRPRLVVLDSVQQVFLGVDGMNADAVAKVYAELFRLRRAYGTTFVMIGHLRKPPAEGQVSKLHLVHGSVAFGTQASTVWVATSPADSLLDLAQAKRRGADRTSLRIRYESEGPDAAIVLTGEGAVEEQETGAERAQDFVVSYLAKHGTSPTGWIVKAAAELPRPFAKRVVERALEHLRRLGRVEQPQRGYNELVKSAEAS